MIVTFGLRMAEEVPHEVASYLPAYLMRRQSSCLRTPSPPGIDWTGHHREAAGREVPSQAFSIGVEPPRGQTALEHCCARWQIQ